MKKDYSTILKRPRITEKATATSESSVYVFDIEKGATKKDVSTAVSLFYKVTPRKITTVTVPAKRVFVRGKWGVSKGHKKAYVYLKKGETIEVI